MGIFSYDLPPLVAAIADLAAAACLLHAMLRAPWKTLDSAGAFSAWCIFVIFLPLMWRFDVPVVRGAALHLLGMPLFVLMFGRQLAIVGLAISVIAFTDIRHGLWANIGMNMLLLSILPAWCGDMVMRATRRFLPNHLFVYLLGNGFFGAMVMLAVTGLISLGADAMWAMDAPLQADTVAYMLLLAWGEAFLTGFLLTMFTVYRPQWVLTFDDDVYLK
ncbi:MAG TPA: energy-coupling factor ABC transporter permease [Noviherbaspirillum sp.]|jgi:uncharacterized membrane protein